MPKKIQTSPKRKKDRQKQAVKNANHPIVRLSLERLLALGSAYYGTLVALRAARKEGNPETISACTVAVEMTKMAINSLNAMANVKHYYLISDYSDALELAFDNIAEDIRRKVASYDQGDSECNQAKRLAWKYVSSGYPNDLKEQGLALHPDCFNIEVTLIERGIIHHGSDRLPSIDFGRNG